MALPSALPLARARARRSWPTTLGRVRSSHADYYEVQAGRASFRGWAPLIAYEYTVDGKHFERTAFVAKVSKLEDAQETTKRYHSGQQVSVRYNPSHPARGMLEGEDIGGSVALTAVGCVLAVLGALLVVASM
jgi:hypothetical protein